jgi:phi LC3 family holin
MKINWTARIKNPVWWAQMVLSVLTPILAYAGITAADVTTWAMLGNLLWGAISNPYVLGLVAVSVWNACNDPTVAGLGDSKTALTYTKPKGSE